jgi:hypothetical protein
VNYFFGLDINLVIANGTDGAGYEMLKLFGVPFKEDKEKA